MRRSRIRRASSPSASTIATTRLNRAWRSPPRRSYFSSWQQPSSLLAKPSCCPKTPTSPDYEAEFAFVIGKGGYRIPAVNWREHVYGYTIVNDVSARDVQFSTSQWSMSKSFPTFCPLGPAIVTADEIADPHQLNIGLSIDGEVLQNSNTRELIFKIPALIEYLSSITPLLPGDIVSTGTPPGVGLGRTPKRWLKPRRIRHRHRRGFGLADQSRRCRAPNKERGFCKRAIPPKGIARLQDGLREDTNRASWESNSSAAATPANSNPLHSTLASHLPVSESRLAANLFGSAFGHNLAAAFAAFRPQVDHPNRPT